MKRILDSSFRYRPSFATDVGKTFEKIRREQRKRARDRNQAEGNVLRLDPPKAAVRK